MKIFSMWLPRVTIWLRHRFSASLVMLAMAHVHAAAVEPVWITHPDATELPVVLHLRQTLQLEAPPSSLWVDVSADNRFILYVNGKRVASGPATSDLAHWRYKRTDLGPYLHAGANDIAAIVWNFSKPAGPMAQISARTGFYFKAEDAAFASLNSGPGWRVKVDAGHKSVSGMAVMSRQVKKVYYVAAAPETIDAAAADWDWTTGALRGEWRNAVAAVEAGQPVPWRLGADPLPDMSYQKADSGKVVRTDLPGALAFPAQAVTIPAHTRARILLDQGTMIAGYPALSVAGGKGATIRMTYSEALYDAQGKKGQRDEVGDRAAKGLFDMLTADGETRTFEPLSWRVWRFIELDVETRESPLALQGLAVHETGYPFQQRARFVSSDPVLNRIWDVGWRTARIDAHETYMDSAYWERLQYVGDTRLQALISYVVTGDDLLAANAIDMFGWSDRNGGLTEGAYPSRGTNVIAPFSLLWIAMLDDYYQRRPDPAVVARNLSRARKVLAWYGQYLNPSNLLKKNPTWNFVDWVGQPSTDRDTFPSFDTNGESCLTTLFYLGALQQMARMEQAVGDAGAGRDDATRAGAIRDALRAKCWSAPRGLFADDPSLTRFSQHSNALAIMYGVATPQEAQSILPRITTASGIGAPEGITPSSYYFSWYLVQASVRAGRADSYMQFLQTWRDLLRLGFTTWPEEPGDTRSDTHAWSAHPTADLLEIVAGVTPAAPGYARARIAPHLGDLTSLDAVVPTPAGPVSVSYRVAGGKLIATIEKPAALPAVFSWRGRDYALKRPRTTLRLNH